ncbi:MAG: hypothetical protein GXP33_13700 [Spirochaetes bacterium]|nr:hypothetical protein [Spirochaetota bacterium]
MIRELIFDTVSINLQYDDSECSMREAENNIASFMVKPSTVNSLWSSFRIVVGCNKNTFIIWPNREGEFFYVRDVGDVLTKYPNTQKGFILRYPSTASCRTIIIGNMESGCVIAAPPDYSGRVTNLKLSTEGNRSVVLNIQSPEETWYIAEYSVKNSGGNSYDAMLDTCCTVLETVRGLSNWRELPTRAVDVDFQLQVGLINEQEKTAVPPEKGFMILADIASSMRRELGQGNILHVFGYGRGHDNGYPDYTPSSMLGGWESLFTAIDAVHGEGQKIVLYMNARIAESSVVAGDRELQKAVLLDGRGKPCTEYYHNREFFVMNPCSDTWVKRLTDEAERLRQTGADGVQLDQIGGRAALTGPAGEWGAGYIKLIKNLKNLGLLVWIQGLSDIYPADWYEATFRYPSVSPDGTIRGGTPLGYGEVRLFLMTVRGRTILIPLSKPEYLKGINGGGNRVQGCLSASYIIDLDNKPAGTFYYNEIYMKKFIDLSRQAKELHSRMAATPDSGDNKIF